MSEQPSAALAAAMERIAAPDPVAAPMGAHLTGALADLAAWWGTVGAGSVLHAVDVVTDGTPGTATEALDAGLLAADRAIDAGATLVVPRVSVRDDLTARAVIVVLTRREPSAVLPQPPGRSDADWMRDCAEIRDRAAAAAHLRGEPVGLLEALDAASIAAVAGALLGAAARRTPCLVDGTDELAAALVADRLCYRAKGWWRAGSDSPDPGRWAAEDRIELTSGLPLRLSDDEALGARATLALLSLVAVS